MIEHDNEIHGIQGSKDEHGVLSVNVPYYASSLEECETVAQGRLVLGVPEKSRSFAAHEGGLYIVNVLYEGQAEPSDEANVVTVSNKGSFTEEPIEAHPKIKEILERYDGKWKDGRVIFPATYRPKASNKARGASKKETEEKPNPFSGVEKYKRLEITFTRTYVARAVPMNLMLRVGTTVNTPPGAAALPGLRRWLVMPPQTHQRGNVVEISEEYLLLDEATPEELHQQSTA